MMRTVMHSTYEFDIGDNFKLVVNDDRSATWLRKLIEERNTLQALLAEALYALDHETGQGEYHEIFEKSRAHGIVI